MSVWRVPLRNDVLWINAAAGTDFGTDLPADRLFVLGGPVSFPGHDVGELRAGSYWTLSSGYSWELKDIFTLRGQSLYWGVLLQGGQTFDRFDVPVTRKSDPDPFTSQVARLWAR